MELKINFLREQRSHMRRGSHIKAKESILQADSFCGSKSCYANRDMFCNLKPNTASSHKMTHQKIYTKEL